MALRVTQGIMYSSFIQNMNGSLSNLMESNVQASSQKKVNRPSDDPVSSGRILSTRATLSTISTYGENIKQAAGWLALADGIVGSGNGSVQTVLARLSELAEQGSSETYDATNREQISFEVRELYKQIINLANTKFDGRYIFAGQNTDTPPYEEALAVTCHDSDSGNPNAIDTASFHVEGAAASTMIIQATSTGAAGSAGYRYSEDSGKTWKTATVNDNTPVAGQCVIEAGGVRVLVSDSSKTVTAVDQADMQRRDNGTWLYVRPTARYAGDDNSAQVVAGYGTSVTGTAEGNFARDVSVRIDAVSGSEISYSYSIDDGSNWIQTKVPQGVSLPVPGGYLTLNAVPNAGDQFQIHPHRADINFQIGDSDVITVNMVGSDIFGGLYDYPQDGIEYPVPVTGHANLFEVVGNLVAAAETNSPDDMGQALDDLKAVMNVVLTKAADIGGRENRLSVTQGALVMRSFSEEDNLSQMEDVDVSELMTRLSQQQIAYNSVLKSSSMIMQMSLVNFL